MVGGGSAQQRGGSFIFIEGERMDVPCDGGFSKISRGLKVVTAVEYMSSPRCEESKNSCTPPRGVGVGIWDRKKELKRRKARPCGGWDGAVNGVLRRGDPTLEMISRCEFFFFGPSFLVHGVFFENFSGD